MSSLSLESDPELTVGKTNGKEKKTPVQRRPARNANASPRKPSRRGERKMAPRDLNSAFGVVDVDSQDYEPVDLPKGVHSLASGGLQFVKLASTKVVYFAVCFAGKEGDLMGPKPRKSLISFAEGSGPAFCYEGENDVRQTVFWLNRFSGTVWNPGNGLEITTDEVLLNKEIIGYWTDDDRKEWFSEEEQQQLEKAAIHIAFERSPRFGDHRSAYGTYDRYVRLPDNEQKRLRLPFGLSPDSKLPADWLATRFRKFINPPVVELQPLPEPARAPSPVFHKIFHSGCVVKRRSTGTMFLVAEDNKESPDAVLFLMHTSTGRQVLSRINKDDLESIENTPRIGFCLRDDCSTTRLCGCEPGYRLNSCFFGTGPCSGYFHCGCHKSQQEVQRMQMESRRRKREEPDLFEPAPAKVQRLEAPKKAEGKDEEKARESPESPLLDELVEVLEKVEKERKEKKAFDFSGMKGDHDNLSELLMRKQLAEPPVYRKQPPKPKGPSPTRNHPDPPTLSLPPPSPVLAPDSPASDSEMDHKHTGSVSGVAVDKEQTAEEAHKAYNEEKRTHSRWFFLSVPTAQGESRGVFERTAGYLDTTCRAFQDVLEEAYVTALSTIDRVRVYFKIYHQKPTSMQRFITYLREWKAKDVFGSLDGLVFFSAESLFYKYEKGPKSVVKDRLFHRASPWAERFVCEQPKPLDIIDWARDLVSGKLGKIPTSAHVSALFDGKGKPWSYGRWVSKQTSVINRSYGEFSEKLLRWFTWDSALGSTVCLTQPRNVVLEKAHKFSAFVPDDPESGTDSDTEVEEEQPEPSNLIAQEESLRAEQRANKVVTSVKSGRHFRPVIDEIKQFCAKEKCTVQLPEDYKDSFCTMHEVMGICAKEGCKGTRFGKHLFCRPHCQEIDAKLNTEYIREQWRLGRRRSSYLGAAQHAALPLKPAVIEVSRT